MNRDGGGFIFLPMLIFLVIYMSMGGFSTGGIGAHETEISASAHVTDVEWHEDAVVAHINVTNHDAESGTVGLHVHYWKGECNKENGKLLHSHGPSVYVPAGETVSTTDTGSTFDVSKVECVSAHVHKS